MIFEFDVYPSITYFTPNGEEERELIDSVISFQPKNYFRSPKYQAYRRARKLNKLPPKNELWKNKMWDGWYRFRKWNRIPTGLFFALVLPHFKRDNINHTVNLKYTNLPIKREFELSDISPRDYQLSAIEDIISARRGVLQLPTNAGKTEIACAIIDSFAEPFIFITHVNELFYQTQKRIEKRLEIQSGLVGDGLREFSPVGNVMMIQTLSSLPEKEQAWLINAPVMIIDEVHHYHGDSPWYDTLMKSNAVVRIGLSATPMRDDEVSDWKLISLTGIILGSISNKFMIEQGYSTPPEIHMVYAPHIIPTTYNYKNHYNKLIKSNKRNRVIYKICQSHQDKQILILVDRLEHGELLQQSIPDSIFLHGSDTTNKRQSIIEQFSNRTLNKILITTLLGEGVDIPSIDVLIFALPMKDPGRVIQKVGRGLRKDEYKEKVYIYDFVDDWSPYFMKQAKQRVKLYKSEGFEIIEEKYEATGL